jgi:hypothetical protein
MILRTPVQLPQLRFLIDDARSQTYQSSVQYAVHLRHLLSIRRELVHLVRDSLELGYPDDLLGLHRLELDLLDPLGSIARDILLLIALIGRTPTHCSGVDVKFVAGRKVSLEASWRPKLQLDSDSLVKQMLYQKRHADGPVLRLCRPGLIAVKVILQDELRIGRACPPVTNSGG